MYSINICSLLNISKVTSYFLKENLTSQRNIVKSLTISIGTVNKITKSDLKQKGKIMFTASSNVETCFLAFTLLYES